MTFQTIEIAGQRLVILPEEEFRKLHQSTVSNEPAMNSEKAKFAVVQPLKVGGQPASEMLIQDRR